MTRAVWFNCFAGIAGDMALGSLVDAGADLDYIRQALVKLRVDGWYISAEKIMKSGISATHVNVVADDQSHSRPWRIIRTILESAELPERVQVRSLSIFGALADVEAQLHGTTADEVHFHEVGGIDAIVDVVGTCAALEYLDIDVVHSSPVAMGMGTVKSAHGTLPNPAPAVVALLKNANVFGINQPFEMTTPTGAAILSALAESFGPIPALQIEASGFGAGTRDIEGLANCTQAIVGRTDNIQTSDRLTVLETNLDDVTGEILAHTIQRLMALGARDAWLTPIVMKKGRPANMISVLTTLELEPAMVQLLQSETGTLGIRSHPVTRYAAARRLEYVEVNGEHIRIKVGEHRVKAEFDDAARVAEKHGLPIREVTSAAEETWKRLQS